MAGKRASAAGKKPARKPRILRPLEGWSVLYKPKGPARPAPPVRKVNKQGQYSGMTVLSEPKRKG